MSGGGEGVVPAINIVIFVCTLHACTNTDTKDI